MINTLHMYTPNVFYETRACSSAELKLFHFISEHNNERIFNIDLASVGTP